MVGEINKIKACCLRVNHAGKFLSIFRETMNCQSNRSYYGNNLSPCFYRRKYMYIKVLYAWYGVFFCFGTLFGMALLLSIRFIPGIVKWFIKIAMEVKKEQKK